MRPLPSTAIPSGWLIPPPVNGALLSRLPVELSAVMFPETKLSAIHALPFPSIAMLLGFCNPLPVGANGDPFSAFPSGLNSVTLAVEPLFAIHASPLPSIAIAVGVAIPPAVKFSAIVKSFGALVSVG